MDWAAYSPVKSRCMLNQLSPKLSAHKRSLFPSNSPQSDDLGVIFELSSSDSETYSPCPVSPASSITPEKVTTRTFGKILQISDYSEFGISSPPQKAHHVHSKLLKSDKENIEKNVSFKKNSHRKILGISNFEDCFDTILPDPSQQSDASQEEITFKKIDNFTTPKKTTKLAQNQVLRKSPRSAHKDDFTVIKPKSFYGNIAPVLATNQTNRIQGMKCVFRPHQPSKAKAKLVFDEKPSKKRERSRSLDVPRDSKRRKTMFTGVNHAIKKHKPSPSSVLNEKRVSIREKAKQVTDLSRTPYTLKKNQKNGWEYTLRFTKPLRYDEELGTKRKFFKTTVKEGASLSPGSPGLMSPTLPKKRKLLDTRKSYLEESSPIGSQLTADMSDLIDEYKEDKSTENSSEVDDILLRLEEDDDSDENKRKVEKEMLMNILEDSPNKNLAIDSLSNYTASLDLNKSPCDSAYSRADLEYTEEDKNASSKMLFSIFNSPFPTPRTGTSHKGSSSKKKWHGVGKDQLQIDAGQKLFGAYQCGECGMIYQRGEAEDETQHNDFHNNMTSLRHTSWKNEKVVRYYGMDYVIMVTANDPKNWQQRAHEVLDLVDKSLGIAHEAPSVLHNQKVFLYISEKRIVGCMAANPVAQAHKLLGSESDVNLCSQETYSVRCGISRMWTLYSHRKMGVATRLLDAVRCNFMYGHILSKEDIAFSIPTPDGKQFAAKYMGFPDFYVYTGY